MDTYEALHLPLKDHIHTMHTSNTQQKIYTGYSQSNKRLTLNFIGKITKRQNLLQTFPAKKKKRFKRNKK